MFSMFSQSNQTLHPTGHGGGTRRLGLGGGTRRLGLGGFRLMLRAAASRVSAGVVAAALGVVIASSHAAPALAADYARLRADPTVSAGLRWIQAALLINDNCDDVSPRIFRGLRTLNSLQNHAETLGYTRDEIKAFVDDGAEQTRVKGEALSYLRAQGVVEGDSATWCSVGLNEIARNTAVGVLLKD